MRTNESRVVFHASDDPALAEAMERARRTFKYFWREMTWEARRIVPGVELAAVKAAFNDPDGGPDDVEHMWISDLRFDGWEMEGVLLNAPHALRTVHPGDVVTLALEEIEDWMYAMQGRAYGGFTIQVTRAEMSAADRRGHDEAWGLDFGDPAAVQLVPNWGAKPSFVGRLFGKAPPPADPDVEHPMSENMREKLAEAVAQDSAAFFTSTDADGFTILHSLALGGSAGGVQVLLEAGADPWLKTVRGKTARELAERMGWPRVVALLEAAEAQT